MSVSQLFRDSALLVQGLLFQSLGREALESLPPPGSGGGRTGFSHGVFPQGPPCTRLSALVFTLLAIAFSL